MSEGRRTAQSDARHSVLICPSRTVKTPDARISALRLSLAVSRVRISVSRARAPCASARARDARRAVVIAASTKTSRDSQSFGSAIHSVRYGGRKKKSQHAKLSTAPSTAGPKPKRTAQAMTTGRYSRDACPLSSAPRPSENRAVAPATPPAAHTYPLQSCREKPKGRNGTRIFMAESSLPVARMDCRAANATRKTCRYGGFFCTQRGPKAGCRLNTP